MIDTKQNGYGAEFQNAEHGEFNILNEVVNTVYVYCVIRNTILLEDKTSYFKKTMLLL